MTHHDSLLVANFYVQTILRGYFQSLSLYEFVRPTTRASLELVGFSTWPYFRPHEVEVNMVVVG